MNGVGRFNHRIREDHGNHRPRKMLEDMPVGYQFKTVGRTITETDLVNFVGNTGMVEVLFTNTLYAKQHAPGGGRIVPGALLLSIAEGLIIQATLQGPVWAFIQMELEVKGPTFAGDTIHVEAEVTQSDPYPRIPAVVWCAPATGSSTRKVKRLSSTRPFALWWEENCWPRKGNQGFFEMWGSKAHP